MAGIVVLDAGALIALSSESDAHHQWAMGMFLHTLSHELSMPALTYAEVMVHPTKAGKAPEFQQRLSGLRIQVRPIDQSDVAGLATLRVESGLRMSDAVVLHESLRLGATLATTDQVLMREATQFGLDVLTPHRV
ncbi:VapC-like toxin [Pontimonas salivibrio]|uniref:VapC-like toxin n=1 Tax=Pontimonas salivibrio TaxID=1159327 RepID=A0A2L2BPZ3_9MICO|nr:PIN domain-containing protein [Pontimonas salivibrio]AVG23672.1 VapC-like toxin [Pontimonas salivibrio]